MRALLPLLFLSLPQGQESEAPAPAPGGDREVEGFRFETGRQAVGRVYRYRKSNVDGTRPSHVDLYIASEDRIESFKYHEGHPEATLVTAEMDWRTFSVRRFETSKRYTDGRIERLAELEAKGDVLHGVAFGNSFTCDVELFPWHSYDFDLASLNVSLRYLEEPEGTVELGMIDVVNGRLAFKGGVELAFEQDEERRGVACRRYSIDGPGLEDRGGVLWVRAQEDPVIVDYEIDLPDEPGMTSGKMALLGTEELTPDEWAEHMAAALR